MRFPRGPEPIRPLERWPRTRWLTLELEPMAPWLSRLWSRCPARSEWGHRCELRRDHPRLHVVLRGLDEYEFAVDGGPVMLPPEVTERRRTDDDRR